MDVTVAGLGILLLCPMLFAAAFAILITSGRPILFHQWRSGRDGQRFRAHKFRTMTVSAPEDGPGVTRSGDARITSTGRWLRKWKLDELPQLVNVLCGEMSLVGPRPDLEEFWALASDEDRAVLALTPGITGAASLAFCEEERLLAAVAPQELIMFYVQQILPRKATLDLGYARRATFLSDCRMILQTYAVLTCGTARGRVSDE